MEPSQPLTTNKSLSIKLSPRHTTGENHLPWLQRVRILLSALLILPLIPYPLFAQLQRYNPNFSISSFHFRDTIPILFEDNQLYIQAQSNGHTHQFNIDTGSSQGLLYSNSDIDGCTDMGNIVSRDANYHLDTVKVVQLPPFQIGQLLISDYVATLMPRPSLNTELDAIVGFDLFNRGLCAKIDTRQGFIVLSDQKQAFKDEEERGFTVKYKLKWFVPYIRVSPFAGHTDEALFDLGSPQLYTINKESFDKHEEQDLAHLNKHIGADIPRQTVARTYGQLAIAAHGTEQKDEVVLLKLDRLKFDDFAFTNLHVVSTQGASRIGAEILRYGAIIINPFRRQITFLPYEDTQQLTPTSQPPQIAFVPLHGMPSVGLVWPHSAPYKAGFRQGDIILQIDQRPIRSFSDFTQFKFHKGEAHRFILRDTNGINKCVECIIKP